MLWSDAHLLSRKIHILLYTSVYIYNKQINKQIEICGNFAKLSFKRQWSNNSTRPKSYDAFCVLEKLSFIRFIYQFGFGYYCYFSFVKITILPFLKKGKISKEIFVSRYLYYVHVRAVGQTEGVKTYFRSSDECFFFSKFNFRITISSLLPITIISFMLLL